jgi:hypothetical protein
MGMTKRLLIMLVVFLAALLNGCIETPKESTPSHYVTVPPAPKQIYLYPGATESFNFWGHEVLIKYTIQNSNHSVEITIDGNKEIFTKSINEPRVDCAYDKKVGNLTYIIRPVTWVTNEAGEKVREFDTWNTSELYFEMVIEGIRGK